MSRGLGEKNPSKNILIPLGFILIMAFICIVIPSAQGALDISTFGEFIKPLIVGIKNILASIGA